MTEKGRASAEAFLFGRYVMFTEVYWHHTGRAFMAMLKRAVLELIEDAGFSPDRLVGPAAGAGSPLACDEERAITELADVARESHAMAAEELLACIRSGRRGMYRRVLSLQARTTAQDPDATADVAAREKLVAQFRAGAPRDAEAALAHALSRETGLSIRSHDVIVDLAMRKDAGADFQVLRAHGRAERMVDLSPVARALFEQFDEATKAVRVFAHPRLRGQIQAAAARRAILSM
ncbi:MAG: hypothetical protein HY292_15175 [Planctomycetes bacterium]|nr:hypothetical protein [Planctomycetota bacterium]